jgi:hypothetical protein
LALVNRDYYCPQDSFTTDLDYLNCLKICLRSDLDYWELLDMLILKEPMHLLAYLIIIMLEHFEINSFADAILITNPRH